MEFRRQSTKFNGVSYVVQRGAEAVYSPRGKEQVRALIDFYMANARLLREGLGLLGLRVFGGVDAPYVWLKTPGHATSWDFFDRLLSQALVGTGQRLWTQRRRLFPLEPFNSRENIEECSAVSHAAG